MNDPDFIWQGDQCIPPWDSRNLLPDWERITATMYNNRTIVSRSQQPLDIPDGYATIVDYADELGASAALLSKLARKMGIPHKTTRSVHLYKREDLDEMVDTIKATPPTAHVTGNEASLILGVDLEEMYDAIIGIRAVGGWGSNKLAQVYVLQDIINSIQKNRRMNAAQKEA